jgi:hypothetical protein
MAGQIRDTSTTGSEKTCPETLKRSKRLVVLPHTPPSLNHFIYLHIHTANTVTKTMTRELYRRERGRRRKGTALLGLLLVAAAATSTSTAAVAAAVSRHGPTATSMGIRSRSSSSCFLLHRLCQQQPRRVVEGECVSVLSLPGLHPFAITPSGALPS